MSSYLISLTVITLLSAYICIVAPSDGGIARYIRLITAFVISIVILSPIAKDIDISFSENFDNNAEETTADYNNLAAKSLALSISSSIESKYKIKADSIKVKTDNKNDFNVEYVEIIFEDQIKHGEDIAEYVSKLYNCKIIIDGSGYET